MLHLTIHLLKHDILSARTDCAYTILHQTGSDGRRMHESACSKRQTELLQSLHAKDIWPLHGILTDAVAISSSNLVQAQHVSRHM